MYGGRIYVCQSYYNNTSTSGIVNITMDLSQDISRFHVIIVEDIIDTGRTLHDVIKLSLKKEIPFIEGNYSFGQA